MANCAYKDCYTVRHPCSKITFFNLPLDAKRREEWIKNAGPDNEKLQNLTDKSKRIFCDKHFEEKYMRRQFNRVTLHPSAVPLMYEDEVKTIDQIEEIKQEQLTVNMEEIMSEDEDHISVPEEKSEVQELFVINLVQGVEAKEDSDDLKIKKESPVMLNKSAQLGARKRILNEASDRLIRKRVLRDVRVVDGRFVFQSSPSIDVDDTSTSVQNESQPEVDLIVTLDVSTQTETLKTDDKSVQIDPEKASSTDTTCQTDPILEESGSKISDSTTSTPKIDDEDSYFCVKVIAEAMKRLSPEKKAEAKLHMISYMFGLEHS